MKKIIGCVFFTLISSLVYSQTYHPLIRTNVTWDEGGYESPLPCYTGAGRSEFILGDSLIEGHYYRLENGYGMVGEPGPGGNICPPFQVDTVAYLSARLREDTLTRMVYIWHASSNDHDQLLYDFSLQVGDTLQSEYTGMGATLILTQIEDVTLLNGEVRKKFNFNNDNECYYIESIGGCFGLGNPIVPGLGFGSELFCVKENGIPIWGEGGCNIPWVSTHETGNITFQVFPNPASDKVTFSFRTLPSAKDARIILYDLLANR